MSHLALVFSWFDGKLSHEHPQSGRLEESPLNGAKKASRFNSYSSCTLANNV
jgi:hypothetical protein